MWDIILWGGFVLLVVGIVKRKTGWGKGTALIGATGVIVSLLPAGPEILDSFQREFRDGYEAGTAPENPNR
jgi:hypothetical protein